VSLALLALIAAGVQLSACSENSSKAASKAGSKNEPSDVEPIKGTSLKRVTLSAQAAKRLGVKTAAIRREHGTGKELIPYSSILYDQNGRTYTYTSPKPLTFVRKRIVVGRIRGAEAVLKQGVPVGTAVVTVGSQELYGVEYEVEED
jgi:ABC-type Fe3+-hydroxamate transport system substrate-binding protein